MIINKIVLIFTLFMSIFSGNISHGEQFDKQLIAQAKSGDQDAQYELALLYEKKDEQSPEDVKKAVYWMTQSANAGQAQAQRDLGYYYDAGEFVEQDFKKAFKYYQLAADQNHAWAQNNLAILYHNGEGVQQSNINALKYYRLSAAQGNGFASFNLGAMYEDGDGVDKNYKIASQYYESAINNCDYDAEEALANLYKTGGYGLKKDLEKAKYFLSKD